MNDRITLNCPGCNANLAVDSQHAGERLKCPKCEMTIAVVGKQTSPPLIVEYEQPRIIASSTIGTKQRQTRIVQMCIQLWRRFSSDKQPRILVLLAKAGLWLCAATAVFAIGVQLFDPHARPDHRTLKEVLEDSERISEYLKAEDERAEYERRLRNEKAKENPDFEHIVLLERVLKGLDVAKKNVDPTGEILLQSLGDKERLRKEESDDIAKARNEHKAEMQAREKAAAERRK